MSLYGTLIFLLLPLNGASRQLVPSDLATRRVTKYELELRKSLRSSSSVRQSRSNWLMSGDNSLENEASPTSDEIHECQEGDPPGVNYSGNVSVTPSGRTCQVWSAQPLFRHCYTWLGDHNHCRNPDGGNETRGNRPGHQKNDPEGQRTRSGPELRRNGRFYVRPKSGFWPKNGSYPKKSPKMTFPALTIRPSSMYNVQLGALTICQGYKKSYYEEFSSKKLMKL